jgi:hypothetical protein
MIKPANQVTAMIVDTGYFTSMAISLSRGFKKTYICNPSWPKGCPSINQANIGYGFDDIEVCYSPFDHWDEVEIYVFLDIGNGAMQCHLEEMGKAVWGSRMTEDLEFDRVACKRLMEKLGLAVGPYEVIKGVKALRQYLKTHDNQHVKLPKWRATMETFKSPNYKLVEPKLDEIEHQLGAWKEELEFVVEEELKDKFEGGVDAWCIDGFFPQNVLCGREIKDKSYVGVFGEYAKIPEPLTHFDKIMAPIFRNYGYRGFYSTEVRMGKDKIPYMIDGCFRAPSPPNELYQAFFSNLSEIVWQGANGICCEPETQYKWGAELIVYSQWATKNWQPISVPKEYEPYLKVKNAVKINGVLYSMPQSGDELDAIGAVVGCGNTMGEAIEMVTEVAKSVEGYYIDVKPDSLQEAQQEIDQAIEMGVFPDA